MLIEPYLKMQKFLLFSSPEPKVLMGRVFLIVEIKEKTLFKMDIIMKQ